MPIVTMKTTATVQTNVGHVRSNNEDNFLLCGTMWNQNAEREKRFTQSEKGTILIHALMDGLGGQNAGEVASAMASKKLMEYCLSLLPHRFVLGQHLRNWHTKLSDTAPMHSRQLKSRDERIAFIQKYVLQTNQEIYELSESEASFAKMGTTFTGLLLDNGTATVMHLGDSRAYLMRDNKLLQLMVDHTEAERMVRLGLLKREEVHGHRSRYLLNRNLGVAPEYGIMQADVSKPAPVQSGDLFLLCSDGLTDMVSDEHILALLVSGESVEEKCELLIQAALDAGGEDNVTVLLVSVEKVQKKFIPFFQTCSMAPWRRTHSHKKQKAAGPEKDRKNRHTTGNSIVKGIQMHACFEIYACSGGLGDEFNKTGS